MKNFPSDLQNFCTFYIVRHGQTQWNVQKRLQGHKDSPLTEEGLQQVKDLAQQLKSVQFDAAYSSDLLRAKRTADIIATEHKLAVMTTELLRERSFGPLEGAHAADMQKEVKYIFQQYELMTEEEKNNPPDLQGVETEEQLISRFITFLRELAVANSKKTLLIVSHGGMITHLLDHLGVTWGPPQQGSRVGNTAYVKLLSDGVDFFIAETQGVNIAKHE